MLKRKIFAIIFGVIISLSCLSTVLADGILDPLGSQNYNTPNTNDIRIFSKDIEANNNPNDYGILLNSSITGENCDIFGNKIYSPTADAIELNTTSGSFRGTKIIGNTLYGGEWGTSTSSGFSIGIAQGKEVVIIGNISKVARKEALHIEDASENLTVSNNIFINCIEDGARILYRSGSSPVILSNNIFQKKSTLLGEDNGIYFVNDSYGVVNQSIVTNNIVDGFAYGLKANGSNTFANNLFTNCDVAISNSGTVYGTNFANDCDTLLEGASGSVAGKIVSYTKPTTILSYVGTNGHIGATLKGFSFPLDAISASQGYTTTLLFALPSRLNGEILLTISSGYDFIVYSANVKWDGTTLVVTDIVNSKSGVLAAPELLADNGNLKFKFYAASARSISDSKVDFDGIFYQQ